MPARAWGAGDKSFNLSIGKAKIAFCRRTNVKSESFGVRSNARVGRRIFRGWDQRHGQPIFRRASVYFCGRVAVGSMRGGNVEIVAHPFIPSSHSQAFGNQHVEPESSPYVRECRPENALADLREQYETRDSPSQGWHRFIVHVCGLFFMLNVGEGVPEILRILCTQNNPIHPMCVSTHFASEYRNLLATKLQDARQPKAYQKAAEKIRKRRFKG